MRPTWLDYVALVILVAGALGTQYWSYTLRLKDQTTPTGVQSNQNGGADHA